MAIDIDREIEALDMKISEHCMEIENLRALRCELIAGKENIEIEDVIEYSAELGISPKRIMALLKAERKTR